MRKDVLEDAASQFVACTAGSSGMTRLETFPTHLTPFVPVAARAPPPRLASEMPIRRPFPPQLALPLADQCTTRHVGTRNALTGRLLVRPRVQIGFDANRDNGMQLRFLLRHWCCLS